MWKYAFVGGSAGGPPPPEAREFKKIVLKNSMKTCNFLRNFMISESIVLFKTLILIKKNKVRLMG